MTVSRLPAVPPAPPASPADVRLLLPGWITDADPWRAVAQRFVREPGAVAAVVVLVTIAVLAAAAPLAAPYAPNAQLDIVALRSQPPSWAHPFGTDQLSRDVLSRVLYGGRVSLVVGTVAMLLATVVGTAYGAIAGYAGGPTDEVLMRLTDACLSIPRVLLVLSVCALWGRLSLGALVAVLGLTGWFGVSRLVRAEVMALRGREWVVAARALGAGAPRILVRQVLPNIVTPVVVATALGIGNVILLEAGLSFLGVGVQPPRPSWGTIIQDGASDIASAWWLAVFPGLAIVATVMSLNGVADGLRAASSPQTAGARLRDHTRG